MLSEICYYCENGRSEGAVFLLTSSCAARFGRGARGASTSEAPGRGSGASRPRLASIKIKAECTPELARWVMRAQDEGRSQREVVTPLDADKAHHCSVAAATPPSTAPEACRGTGVDELPRLPRLGGLGARPFGRVNKSYWTELFRLPLGCFFRLQASPDASKTLDFIDLTIGL